MDKRGGEKMKQNNAKIKCIFLVIAIGLILFLTMITSHFYQQVLKESEIWSATKGEKKAHYVMILDDENSIFWDSVYESAKKEAENENIILELSKNSSTISFAIKERMQMSIAAKVDGIILEYNDQEGLDEEIQIAKQNQIPVVTISNDASRQGSISFIGVSDYQLGKKYGEQIIKLLKPDMKKIMIIDRESEKGVGTETIYNQINNMVHKVSTTKNSITLERKHILSNKEFDAEEAIWSIFQNKEELPDILVCLNEMDTECAYQALINYNLVGQVSIIGYYYTDIVLNGLIEGIIPVTVELDTEQIGQYAIQALTKYLDNHHVDCFYSVDLNMIDQKKAEEMREYEEEKVL